MKIKKNSLTFLVGERKIFEDFLFYLSLGIVKKIFFIKERMVVFFLSVIEKLHTMHQELGVLSASPKYHNCFSIDGTGPGLHIFSISINFFDLRAIDYR